MICLAGFMIFDVIIFQVFNFDISKFNVIHIFQQIQIQIQIPMCILNTK